jgi:hypothetical protein
MLSPLAVDRTKRLPRFLAYVERPSRMEMVKHFSVPAARAEGEIFLRNAAD